MIYSLNEARNVEEYRAEKAAREKAEQDKKNHIHGDSHYNSRYSRAYYPDGETYDPALSQKLSKKLATRGERVGTGDHSDDNHTITTVDNIAKGYRNHNTKNYTISGHTYTDHRPDKEDKKRDKNAQKFVKRNSTKYDLETRDAVNRNMRRHPERWDGDKPVKPKSESTIFDDIEII